MQERSTGRYGYPLDHILELTPRQHASPWVVAQAVALATRVPYRQATALLTGWLEAPVDHRTVYAWVQQAGAQVVAEETPSRRPCLSTERYRPVARASGNWWWQR